MRGAIRRKLCGIGLLMAMGQALAAPVLVVLGKDYTFPNRIEGLQINSFETNDGVKLTYWEAGQGQPIVFVPGWSANGAEYIQNDIPFMSLVLFDHASNDWRDVVRHKINVPTAIFTGEYSDSTSVQRWLQSVVPGSRLYVYSKAEQGDHFLAFKNPFKFTQDLDAFLKQ